MVKTALFLMKKWGSLKGGSIVLCLMTFFVVGCESPETSPVVQEEIRIGVAGPMTGDQSKLGGDLQRGARLAVEEWNTRGGIRGSTIVLEVGDDQRDPKQAVSVANKMVNLGIVGMIGHYNSSASIPASSVYHDAGIPMITPASTNPRLTEQGYKNVFRVVGRDDQQGNVAAKFIATQLKAKRIAILHDKTTYGQGLAEELRKSLLRYKAEGLELVSFDGLTQGDKDFRGILTRLKEQNLDLYFFGGMFPEGGLLVKQANEVGLNVPMMSGDGVIDPKFIEIAGKAAEGTYLTFTPDTEKLPQAAAFLKKYRAKYGEDLAPYAIYAYDATNILLSALSETKKGDKEKLIEHIRGMKYQGALGSLTFDEKGDVTESPYIVWLTKKEGFEAFWTPPE
ncbi:MAG: branched-chain amino acid ABC transporter substrate-binding protein [Nitrospirae bacterium]|nr:branched-chain amino acid ABC transporter substrate-binding protein [Candidatus Manganitrophaceae bacterium]